LWQTILAGKVWHGELVNRRKDGSLYDEEMTIAPLCENSGDVVTHFVAIKQDITARKYKEELLKESEKKLLQAKEDLENILNAATEISITATDKDGLIKIFNRGAELMLGYSAEEMVGKQTPAIFHDLQEVQQRGKELSLKHGKLISGFQVFVENANLIGRENREWTYVRKDKSTLIVSLTVTAVLNNENEIIGYLGIADDITQRKIAENALKASEERLNLSQEYGEIGSWEADLGSDQQIWSPAMFKLIDLPFKENPTWHEFIELVLPEDRQLVFDATQAHIEKGEKYDVEYRMFKQNKNIHWMRSAGRAEFSQNGTPIKFIGIAQDVTHRKKMELELQRSNAELEQFAYAVSHDMRQPLRMVSSYLGLLEKSLGKKLDEEEQQFLQFALDGAKRMDNMILSLLEYSRVGRQEKPYVLISTRKCLDEALAFLTPALHESSGTVDVSGDWIELVVIADELTRLLQNLIGNALKYHDENKLPLVQVRASVIENVFRVEVQDNGIGIEPNQINRLFKVFSRLQARSRFDGTGVGLALCRKVVEHHGGKIGVDSQGEGYSCTFWFELPIKNSINNVTKFTFIKK
jgi:signal transduction histidine kinase